MIRTALLALVLAACHDAAGKQEPKSEAGSATGSGSAVAKAAPPSSDDYVPAEFKNGMSRWKDTGVYLDGKPIAFLTFGELPIALKPTWLKDKVSDNKPPGCPIEKCPGWKWAEQRTYRFTDYLAAIGVDVKKIKMVHVYGPKLSQSIAVSAKDFARKDIGDFYFRFGLDIAGKPIPHVPPNFGNGKQPDKINGVMIYVDKKPPTITRDGIELDGVDVTGVPYYGEPLRGGVRIYLDDRYAASIKRQDLDVKKATTGSDGDPHWKLVEFLAANGVDTSKVVEGWVIRDDKRAERIPWSELQAMSFSASSRAHGGVLLGDKEILVNALALHSRELKPDELPVIRPDEE